MAPLGEIKMTPAPLPCIFEAPSTNNLHLGGDSILDYVAWVHSTMKSTSAWPLIAFRG